MTTSAVQAPIGTYPISACVMLSIPNKARPPFTEVGEKCRRAWKLAHPEKPDTNFEVPKNLHISLGTYFARDTEQVARINDAFRTIFETYKPFSVQPHPTKGVTLFEASPSQPQQAPKDFVACQVMVANQGQNAEHKLLMKISKQLFDVIKANGGVPARADYIPHVTVGKISPPGTNGFRPEQASPHPFTVSAKNLMFNQFPRSASPAPQAAAASTSHAPASPFSSEDSSDFADRYEAAEIPCGDEFSDDEFEEKSQSASHSSLPYGSFFGPRFGRVLPQITHEEPPAAAAASSNTYKRQRPQASQEAAPLPSPVDQKGALDTIKELTGQLEGLYQTREALQKEKGHDLSFLQNEIDALTVQIQSAAEALSAGEPKAKVKKS